MSTAARALLAALLLCAAPARAVDGAAAAQGLTQHNAVRSIVALGEQPGQPAGANIVGLTWDDDLAAVAQAWADRCVFEHNGGRSDDYGALGGSDYVGENIYAAGGQEAHGPAIATAVALWFSEVDDYTYPGGYSGGTGHYTQLLWATTRRVGCGVADCDSLQFTNSAWSNAQIVVCDYAPGGNSGGSLYEEGAACSQCPGDLPACAEGLCVPAGFGTDAGHAAQDAGHAAQDGGAHPPGDGGGVLLDDDAGTGDDDGGSDDDDAGTHDDDGGARADGGAGSGDDDAGTGEDDAGPGGGPALCACAQGSTPTGGTAAGALALLLLGAIVRRRRSHTVPRADAVAGQLPLLRSRPRTLCNSTRPAASGR